MNEYRPQTSGDETPHASKTRHPEACFAFTGLTAAMRATRNAATRLPVDANGAPVTLDAKEWLVCFVPGLRPQWWHPFVHKAHKHVFALYPNEDSSWTLFEPWWSRLLVTTITTDQAIQFLRWAAMGDVLLVREAVPGRGSQMRGWANCAVLTAFLLGRCYRVWSPNALYRKLKRETDAKQIDLDTFLGRHLYGVASRQASRYALFLNNALPIDLDRALREFGRAFLHTAASSEFLGICRTVFAADENLPSVARCFWEGSSTVAEVKLAAMLDTARKRGIAQIEDSTTAARHFLGLLRSGLQQEVLLGLRPAPADEEIGEAVDAAVDLFLNGATRKHFDRTKQPEIS